MAETQFAKLDHRTPIERAEVRRVGGGWNAPGVTRADPASHLPLTLPGGNVAPPPMQPEPTPPTEAELRDALAQCLLARAVAADELARAKATDDRAHRSVEAYRARLDGFASLDEDTTAAMITALRDVERRSLESG